MKKHKSITIEKNQSVLPVPENQKLELIIGDWKGLLGPDALKISLAIALNHCHQQHRMQLLGYLITDQKVSLIIEGKKNHVEHLLSKFYDELVTAVADHLKVTDPKGHVLQNWQKHVGGSLGDLFDRGLLHDPHLISLLLGQAIDLPYYSAEVETMKREMRKYEYCSAIDYSGAEGPVRVKTNWNVLSK